ncbi:MAG: type II toxin-antitoxin system HicA family toxin [Clostridia bacterium]|nr:type II toxin-antitoxin system HicA family toxin [Clostridia bacterium]
MKRYSPKKVINILLKNGWIEKRIRGSHHIFIKQNEEKIVTISTSKNPIPIGTLKNIEKQSNIKFN